MNFKEILDSVYKTRRFPREEEFSFKFQKYYLVLKVLQLNRPTTRVLILIPVTIIQREQILRPRIHDPPFLKTIFKITHLFPYQKRKKNYNSYLFIYYYYYYYFLAHYVNRFLTFLNKPRETFSSSTFVSFQTQRI